MSGDVSSFRVPAGGTVGTDGVLLGLTGGQAMTLAGGRVGVDWHRLHVADACTCSPILGVGVSMTVVLGIRTP